MDSAAQALLVIVSSVLSVFLLLLTVLTVYCLIIVRHIKRIVERADSVAGSVEAAASAFEKTATPLAMLKLISNIVSRVQGTRRKKEKL